MTLKTISSMDLAVMVNRHRGALAGIRHPHMLARARALLSQEALDAFECVYVSGNGSRQLCYHFPPREAVCIASYYSYAAGCDVYDRMVAPELAIEDVQARFTNETPIEA